MIIGLDIGGTSVKMALLDRECRIYRQKEASTSYDQYKTPMLTTILRETEAFLQETLYCPETENPSSSISFSSSTSTSSNSCSCADEEKLPTSHALPLPDTTLECIGISATGQVDSSTGTIIGTNGMIPGYEGTCFSKALEEKFHVPVYVVNDANAAALGEWYLGAGQGCKDVLMVTIGTGVGGGIVLGGHLYEGKRGIAGEIGHFTLYQDGVYCGCGRRGCFECYASTSALVRNAKKETGDETLDGREFFRRLAAGDDPLYAKIMHAWMEDIAGGVSGLVHIFNPEMVILGGGVSEQETLFIEPLRKLIYQSCMPRFAEGLRIEHAKLGNRAGIIGAVTYCLQKMSV